LEETAHGIIEIANSAMVNALRLVSVRRGHDPRGFVMVGFGGAGPVHANRIAAEADVPTVLIPMSPGIASAMGLLVTDLKHDFSVTMIQHAKELDADAVDLAFTDMVEQGRIALARELMPTEDMSFERSADMRYYGQSFELTVSLPEKPLTGVTLDAVLSDFHRAHEQAYGFAAGDEPVEFVNLRLTAIGTIAKPALRKLGSNQRKTMDAISAEREVYFVEANGWTSCPVYDRYLLASKAELVGPAIVEERDSTTVIHPGFVGSVDEYGNIFISQANKR
jgi:N-methylhydantoinase A